MTGKYEQAFKNSYSPILETQKIEKGVSYHY